MSGRTNKRRFKEYSNKKTFFGKEKKNKIVLLMNRWALFVEMITKMKDKG
jgi:hypothetical protein